MKVSKCNFVEKNDGIAYMAQRIDEMLNHYTDDIYKVPYLNTHFLVKEYLDTENCTIVK